MFIVFTFLWFMVVVWYLIFLVCCFECWNLICLVVNSVVFVLVVQILFCCFVCLFVLFVWSYLYLFVITDCCLLVVWFVSGCGFVYLLYDPLIVWFVWCLLSFWFWFFFGCYWFDCGCVCCCLCICSVGVLLYVCVFCLVACLVVRVFLSIGVLLLCFCLWCILLCLCFECCL